jgi:hypothetical protein
MANPPSPAAQKIGPFPARASSGNLIELASTQEFGLRLVDSEEQARDYYRQRCESLSAAAREFFYDYEGSAALVFQKAGDSEQIPEFIEYIYCWLARDTLGGVILFGVSSDAGTHEQIDLQENAFWDQSAEIAAALGRKYTQNPESLVNYFNFEQYTVLPHVAGIEPMSVFLAFEELVTTVEDHGAGTTVETHYSGPAVVRASQRKLHPDRASAAAHASLCARTLFCNDDCFVIYNQAIERYVRSIESLHAFTNLVYLSREVMDGLGRRLNSERSARIQAEAQREIDRWQESLRLAEEAKQARISRLSEIL